MNWGNKLIFVFIGFAALLGYMAYRCIMIPVDLVSKEYYNDELAYQQVIDAKKSANTLSSEVAVSQTNAYVNIEMPKEMRRLNPSGTILFYCPSASANDKIFPIKINEDGSQQIGLQKLVKGDYTVKINWNAASRNYYAEKHFVIH